MYVVAVGRSLPFWLLIIRYNQESNKWMALSEKSPDFVATSEVSGPSLVLGPQTWRVSNDSAACSGSAASYTVRLSLSACQAGRQSGQVRSGHQNGPLSLVQFRSGHQNGPLSLVQVPPGCGLIG